MTKLILIAGVGLNVDNEQPTTCLNAVLQAGPVQNSWRGQSSKTKNLRLHISKA